VPRPRRASLWGWAGSPGSRLGERGRLQPRRGAWPGAEGSRGLRGLPGVVAPPPLVSRLGRGLCVLGGAGGSSPGTARPQGPLRCWWESAPCGDGSCGLPVDGAGPGRDSSFIAHCRCGTSGWDGCVCLAAFIPIVFTVAVCDLLE